MLHEASGSQLTVLIVDDDKFVLQILGKILQKAGYGVTAVETGREALQKLETQTYQAALIDVRLQDMNGLDLLNQIQRIAPNMTKIVLTGYPTDEDRIKALQLGANHYLAKPIKSETLIGIIENGLKRKNESNQNPKMPKNPDLAYSVTKDIKLGRIEPRNP